MTQFLLLCCQIAAVALGLGLYLVLRGARRIVKEPVASARQPVTVRRGVDRLALELKSMLRDLDPHDGSREGALPAAVPGGKTLRAEILRLAGLGADAHQIAGCLPVPLAEADLLVRVARLCRTHARQNG